jgi:hypothetical protein
MPHIRPPHMSLFEFIISYALVYLRSALGREGVDRMMKVCIRNDGKWKGSGSHVDWFEMTDFYER